MSNKISERTTPCAIIASLTLLLAAATPASAQGEFLTQISASYALAVAGVGFLAGYSGAPHLVRAWVNRRHKSNH